MIPGLHPLQPTGHPGVHRAQSNILLAFLPWSWPCRGSISQCSAEAHSPTGLAIVSGAASIKWPLDREEIPWWCSGQHGSFCGLFFLPVYPLLVGWWSVSSSGLYVSTQRFWRHRFEFCTALPLVLFLPFPTNSWCFVICCCWCLTWHRWNLIPFIIIRRARSRQDHGRPGRRREFESRLVSTRFFLSHSTPLLVRFHTGCTSEVPLPTNTSTLIPSRLCGPLVCLCRILLRPFQVPYSTRVWEFLWPWIPFQYCNGPHD